jgi:hypothetical protein
MFQTGNIQLMIKVKNIHVIHYAMYHEAAWDSGGIN